jgi:hypothetical protein
MEHGPPTASIDFNPPLYLTLTSVRGLRIWALDLLWNPPSKKNFEQEWLWLSWLLFSPEVLFTSGLFSPADELLSADSQGWIQAPVVPGCGLFSPVVVWPLSLSLRHISLEELGFVDTLLSLFTSARMSLLKTVCKICFLLSKVFKNSGNRVIFS